MSIYDRVVSFSGGQEAPKWPGWLQEGVSEEVKADATGVFPSCVGFAGPGVDG